MSVCVLLRLCLVFFFPVVRISPTLSSRTTKSGETILVLATVITCYSSIDTGKRNKIYYTQCCVRGFRIPSDSRLYATESKVRNNTIE